MFDKDTEALFAFMQRVLSHLLLRHVGKNSDDGVQLAISKYGLRIYRNPCERAVRLVDPLITHDRDCPVRKVTIAGWISLGNGDPSS